MVHLKKSRKDRISTSPIIENNVSSSDDINTNKDKPKSIERNKLDKSSTGVKFSTQFNTSSKENHVEVSKVPPGGKNKNEDSNSDEDSEVITTTRSTNSVITINKIFTPNTDK